MYFIKPLEVGGTADWILNFSARGGANVHQAVKETLQEILNQIVSWNNILRAR